MSNTAKIVRLDLAAIVDQLGALKAQQSDLKKRSGTLQEQLVKAGVTEAEGALFRATVSTHDVETINWEAIARKLNPSQQLITGNTSKAKRTTVKIVARKT